MRRRRARPHRSLERSATRPGAPSSSSWASGPRAVGRPGRPAAGQPAGGLPAPQGAQGCRVSCATSRSGTRRVYSLDPDGIAGLRDYLDRFWNTALHVVQDPSRTHAGIDSQPTGGDPMTDSTAVSTSIVVEAPVEHAFSVFTEDIGSWWPPEHHIIEAPLDRMVFEPRAGGHVYDVGDGRQRCRWARVLAYEPPHRVVFSWNISTAVAARDRSRPGPARSRCASSPEGRDAHPGRARAPPPRPSRRRLGGHARRGAELGGWNVGLGALSPERLAGRAGCRASLTPPVRREQRSTSAEPAARDVRTGRTVHAAHHDGPVGLQLNPGLDHHADGPLLGGREPVDLDRLARRAPRPASSAAPAPPTPRGARPSVTMRSSLATA